MRRSFRWLVVAALPLAACNIQISGPDGTYGTGDTQLPPPSGLVAVALDNSVHLSWTNSVATSYPGEFKHFRIYSTSYSSGSGRCDSGGWLIEGTTVSDTFLVGNLRNGVPLCFAVSTVARDGGEGPRSQSRVETPRHVTFLSM
jgi:hypothetical protein